MGQIHKEATKEANISVFSELVAPAICLTLVLYSERFLALMVLGFDPEPGGLSVSLWLF